MKNVRIKTSYSYPKEPAKRESGSSWRNRFLKEHRGTGTGNHLKANDLIPECYNYAWGYF